MCFGVRGLGGRGSGVLWRLKSPVPGWFIYDRWNHPRIWCVSRMVRGLWGEPSTLGVDITDGSGIRERTVHAEGMNRGWFGYQGSNRPRQSPESRTVRWEWRIICSLARFQGYFYGGQRRLECLLSGSGACAGGQRGKEKKGQAGAGKRQKLRHKLIVTRYDNWIFEGQYREAESREPER